MDDNVPKMPVPQTAYIRLPDEAFAALGVQQIAYVKPIVREGETVFEVHAADGTAVALLESLDVAAAAVRQHGLEPLRVH
jgi:hypothetical protein